MVRARAGSRNSKTLCKDSDALLRPLERWSGVESILKEEPDNREHEDKVHSRDRYGNS